ncbi:zinc finger protein CONSTANS-LIKE 16-like [Silene latifolia]|uniref:zinc finger protein CONSTANS-LIKE 16-like n=1 Tax=Silene latifolia TaxID=37657 RepID=UPI003D770020
MSPKKKEDDQQVVPVTNQASIETLQDLRGFPGINNNVEEDDEDKSVSKHDQMMHNSDAHEYCVGWDLTSSISWEVDQADHNTLMKKQEVDNSLGFWGECNNNVAEETNANLNLNLNHEQVLEAWSNRGSLWAYNNDHHPSFSASKFPYVGEVPNLEDERTSRETSVLRYKNKRQTRLFAKKIRYQVRKKNADNRPRHKGRFVKLVSNDEKSREG